MASYGFSQPRYGMGVQRTPQPFASSMVKAASGAPTVGDPFGLLSGSPGHPTIDGTTVAPKATPAAPAVAQGPVSAPPPAAPPAGSSTQPPQGPTPAAYDINTDPVLQQVNAYTGMSDQQAQALADKQKRDLVIQTGLESLAQNLFPGDSNLAQAAAKNPTSTKATIDTQKVTALHDLLNSLTTGGHNLGYSGYRIDQEQNVGNQYENALAQAAAGARGQFNSIDEALAGTRRSNDQSRVSAFGDAYNRFVQQALANPPVGDQQGTTPPPPDPTTSAFPDSYWTLLGLAKAAAGRNPIHA